jgi:hypothetical protein
MFRRRNICIVPASQGRCAHSSPSKSLKIEIMDGAFFRGFGNAPNFSAISSTPARTDRSYSNRRATIGSIRAALRAGIIAATHAVSRSSAAMAIKITGSFRVIRGKYTKVVSNRVTINDATNPIPMPMVTRSSPCRKTIKITFLRKAPSAIRMPIS